MSNLRNEIGSLSATEKFELLDVLWESLEAEPTPLTDEQRDQLESRATRYQRNPSDVVPWEEIKRSLLKKS